MINDLRLKKKSIFLLFVIFNLYSLIFILPANLVNADESVSATVPPRPTDFQFSFSSSSLQPITQGQDVSYQITYGSLPSANMPTTITLMVSWNGITAPDNSQLFDYAVGSASNGYGGTVPVVDPIHKTITWTIPDIPAGTTDQTVNFQLKTITSYNKSNAFPFTIGATMSNQYLTLPTQTLMQTYQYKTPTANSVQPTTTPTQTITPTPTPTVTPSVPIFQLNTVTITSLSDSEATIQTTTNEPTKLEIRYGTTPTALTQTVGTNSFTLTHSLNLSGLNANKTYYFQTVVTNTDGETISSDVFTLHTANPSALPNLENNIIVLSSNGNIFSSNSQQESDLKNPSIILTDNTDDTIAYTLTNPIAVKTIDVIVTNNVLGANTFTPSHASNEYIFPMQKRTPTLYVANLTTIPQGSYQVAVRITDDNGNIIQKPISSLKIMPSLIVYGQDTGRPLSDARIYLSYYDEQTKSYQPVTSALFGSIKNPTYTDTFGKSTITLPTGTYRIEESSLFYDPQTRDFTIGPGSNQNFPILYLKRDPLNLISLFTYMKDYFQDSWTKILTITFEFSSSVRIFHLVALEILVTFVCLTFFLFLFRSHLRLKHLPIFIRFHLNSLLKKSQQQYIFGYITDEQNNPLTRVLIEIEDAETKNILTEGSSHKSGKFYFTNSFGKPINLLCIKEGFEPTSIAIDTQTDISEAGLHIIMNKGTSHHASIISAFISGLEEGFGMLFEAFLIGSFILEILFSFFLSTQITLPVFFTLSILNIILWIFYLKEKRN